MRIARQATQQGEADRPPVQFRDEELAGAGGGDELRRGQQIRIGGRREGRVRGPGEGRGRGPLDLAQARCVVRAPVADQERGDGSGSRRFSSSTSRSRKPKPS